MLLHTWVDQLEHRRWEQDFNARAARGEFVRHARGAPVTISWLQRLDPLEPLRKSFARALALL